MMNEAQKQKLLSCSAKLVKQTALPILLDARISLIRLFAAHTKRLSTDATAVLAWGRKPSARKAARLAQNLKLPLWQLEDGFIHSLGQGVLGTPSWSLVLDKAGIYYDATSPSDLETLLEYDFAKLLADPVLLERAKSVIALMLKHGISKYNNTSPFVAVETLLNPANVTANTPKILVVDQTAGDMSLQYGLLQADAPQRMLAAALSEYPEATIFIKTHPDVLAGKKRGCFDRQFVEQHERIVCLTQALNPIRLVQAVDHVYVMTSQLGFEALLAGKTVTCFGMPFYAGWGLTDDRVDRKHSVFQRRTQQRSLEQVFAAAYLLYSRYVHPDAQERCELEAILAYIMEQQAYWAENRGDLYAFGFTRWKQNYIRRFLYAPSNKLHFFWRAKQALRKGFQTNSAQLVVWGERAIQEARQLAEANQMSIWRVEDGFIRSVGLGSDYTAPLSLVLDKQGIYYDPAQPSDLENLLQTYHFSDELLARSANLRKMLLQSRLSKYNCGQQFVREHTTAGAGQAIILVPGQVEDDASIRKGCRDIKTNTALLEAVKAAKPAAYIIYKPHPDVVSGNRRGKVAKAVLASCCDLVLDDASVTDCLDIADEVHTMTSLVGFEALLRGKAVTCYGLPFYAGWGLTQDRHVVERRQRKLSLDALVAASLILYPRYLNWRTGAFTTPEFAIQLLQQQLYQQGGKQKNKMNWLQRQWRKAIHVYRGVFNFRY
ncbi:MAG: beta-3-deoxy-D-manno-oct-2-ulosonic acid transferase [Proteobacteria bacterium]|nr:MAG: beta-3-deoxy-D-manno-oct-2-ulosonic acid transferase [Pseudomonadota bacterium]